ncbi:MAG TPA: TlpA disulfide reductase family protein [Acidimicrobiia bacterium]|nr:TlpA disulfide reductase family protein [Acidimicrobiia bacterium]
MFVTVLVVGLALAWALDGRSGSAETGEPAPDFTVQLLEGGSFTLADHISGDGRPMVLNLWASWCPPCREEIPDLSAFATASPGIAVIGVAVEDRLEDAQAFAAQIRPDYPLAIGNAAFEQSYPNFGLPVTYFLDGTGEVTEVFNGVLTVEALEEKTG